MKIKAFLSCSHEQYPWVHLFTCMCSAFRKGASAQATFIIKILLLDVCEDGAEANTKLKKREKGAMNDAAGAAQGIKE